MPAFWVLQSFTVRGIGRRVPGNRGKDLDERRGRGDAAIRPGIVKIEGLTGLYDIEPRNQIILGSSRGPSRFHDEFLDRMLSMRLSVFEIGRGVIGGTGLQVWPMRAVLSPGAEKVAALFVDAKSYRVSLQYGPLSWDSVHEVYSFMLDANDPERTTLQNHRGENFSWAQDGSRLAYSLGGVSSFMTRRNRRQATSLRAQTPAGLPTANIWHSGQPRALLRFTT
jgi:hypothetical protein